MEKTIVFFDIDGTLIGLDKHLPGDAAEAVRALRRNGHLAVINTGRPYSHIEPAVVEIGFDGFICSCGSHLLWEGETVNRRVPTAEVCRKMIELVRRCGLSPLYEGESGLFFDGTMPMVPGVVRQREHYASRGFPVDFDIDTPGFRFDKFCAYVLPGCDLETFKAEAGKYFEVIGREDEMLEMPMKGCTKGTGIRWLCGRTGIPAERCLAVGDGKNDRTMFRAVGHSAVMGDGDPDVFGEAEYITAGLDEGGVAKALRHFGLI